MSQIDLPPELLTLVIEFALEGEDRLMQIRDLRRFALVGRSWAGPTQRLLLRHIVIHSRKRILDITRILKKANLRHLVWSVEFSCWSPGANSTFVKVMTDLLPSLPSLRRVFINTSEARSKNAPSLGTIVDALLEGQKEFSKPFALKLDAHTYNVRNREGFDKDILIKVFQMKNLIGLELASGWRFARTLDVPLKGVSPKCQLRKLHLFEFVFSKTMAILSHVGKGLEECVIQPSWQETEFDPSAFVSFFSDRLRTLRVVAFHFSSHLLPSLTKQLYTLAGSSMTHLQLYFALTVKASDEPSFHTFLRDLNLPRFTSLRTLDLGCFQDGRPIPSDIFTWDPENYRDHIASRKLEFVNQLILPVINEIVPPNLCGLRFEGFFNGKETDGILKDVCEKRGLYWMEKSMDLIRVYL